MFGIVWGFHIAIRNTCGQRYAAFTVRFLHSTDFAAGIAGVKLVEQVLDTGKSVVHTIQSGCVVAAVDGDIADTVLREREACVQSGKR